MAQQEFKYPGSDLDRARNLVAALGSFWARTYTAIDQVTSYAVSTAQQVNQTHRNLLETLAALSRYEVPLFHEEVITPVVLKKSQRNRTQNATALFDEAETANFNGELRFDTPAQSEFFYFPLPEKLVDVGQLFNQITFPTAALARNVDFAIADKRRALVLAADPFDNPAFIKRAVVTDGQPDEEITLWGFFGKFDYDYVFEQFAYAVGIRLKTSQGYKDLVNAVISGLIDGALTVAQLDAALSAIGGIPISSAVAETVEAVTHDAAGCLVLTDKTVYRLPRGANVRVVPGQALLAGTQLVEAVDILEFFIGNSYMPAAARADDVVCAPPPANNVISDFDWGLLTDEAGDSLALNTADDVCRNIRKKLSALTVGPEFLSACFYSELIFENKEVPLEVDNDHDTGYTFVKFKVGGFPDDVEAFFNEMHARGIQAYENRGQCGGKRRTGTLAHILDKRKNALTEPTSENLPKTINPLTFIVENVLRNNVFIVRINTEALGQNRLGLYNIRHIKPLIPPQTAMIVVFELAAKRDAIRATDLVHESTSTFIGANPLQDAVSQTLVRDSVVSVRRVSGTCQ